MSLIFEIRMAFRPRSRRSRAGGPTRPGRVGDRDQGDGGGGGHLRVHESRIHPRNARAGQWRRRRRRRQASRTNQMRGETILLYENVRAVSSSSSEERVKRQALSRVDRCCRRTPGKVCMGAVVPWRAIVPSKNRSRRRRRRRLLLLLLLLLLLASSSPSPPPRPPPFSSHVSSSSWPSGLARYSCAPPAYLPASYLSSDG
jgi:hypothetical protein